MKSLASKTAIASIIALGLLSIRAFADASHAGLNTTQPSSSAADAISPVQSISMAGQLAAYARENHDAIELAAAARVLAANQSRPMPTDKYHQKESGPGDKTASHSLPTAQFTPEALLKEARLVAKDNPDTLAAIGAIEQTIATVRGHPGGAFVDHDVLLPDGGTMNYTITFAGNQPMEVAVFANGPGAIDWHIFDENGNEVQSQSSDHFRITPKWTGPFKVKLANKTKTYIPYTLATN